MSMNRTILITGASSGIGRACAERFAQEGWNVIATMRNNKGKSFTDYHNIFVTEMDVVREDSIRRALREGIAQFGAIDVLLNNAGWGAYGIFEDAPDEVIKSQFDTNLLGVIRMIRAVLPYFRKQKSGMILNVTSVGGRIALPYLSLYYTSKWAVEGLSEALKFELDPLGIQVKIIEPGIVETDFVKNSCDFSKHLLDEYEPISDKAGEVLFKLSGGIPGSTPVHIADDIYTAATDGSARLRYPAGADAKVFLKRKDMLSDEEFISMIGGILKG